MALEFSSSFISCDWGTSNLRLRLVDTNTLDIIKEYESGEGVKLLYESYLEKDSVSQLDYFGDFLISIVDKVFSERSNIPIIISGMASSTIGLCELPYAEFPFRFSGEDILYKHILFKDRYSFLVVSGISNEQGMMRGEEIQVIGIADQLPQKGSGILILPGTHSKHIKFDNAVFCDLKNYMTGELFALLAKDSILSYSLEESLFTVERSEFFRQGVIDGSHLQMTSKLFSIRANDLLHNTDKRDNYYYLSGLMIGEELSTIGNDVIPIYLLASERLGQLYGKALDILFSQSKHIALTIEKSTLKGHKKALFNYSSNTITK